MVAPPPCRRLGEKLAGHALQLTVGADVLEKVSIGTEADAAALDVRRRLESLQRDDTLREALAVEVHLQRADLLQHDTLALEQVRLDELLGGGQHSHDVGLGGRGGKLNVLAQRLEVVVTGLHGAVSGVVNALGAAGVGTTHNLISNRHSTQDLDS